MRFETEEERQNRYIKNIFWGILIVTFVIVIPLYDYLKETLKPASRSISSLTKEVNNNQTEYILQLDELEEDLSNPYVSGSVVVIQTAGTVDPSLYGKPLELSTQHMELLDEELVIGGPENVGTIIYLTCQQIDPLRYGCKDTVNNRWVDVVYNQFSCQVTVVDKNKKMIVARETIDPSPDLSFQREGTCDQKLHFYPKQIITNYINGLDRR